MLLLLTGLAHLAMGEHGGAARTQQGDTHNTQSVLVSAKVTSTYMKLNCGLGFCLSTTSHTPWPLCCQILLPACSTPWCPVLQGHSHAEASCALHIHEKAVG